MGIGLSGMVSGLDTDAIVKAMVSGQQAKATKVENKITLNKWTKEAWSGLNTKIYSFYTKYASKLRLQTSYMTRSASSSNESVVKVTAGSSAAVGTHSLQVKKLASSQYVTGRQLKTKDANGNETKANYNKNTKLAGENSLGIAAGTIITIKGQVGTEDEEVVKLEVNEKTTINDFLNACKEAGLTASFDTNQQRFFISSSESGVEDKFTITTSKLSGAAEEVFTGTNGVGGIDSMITKEYMTSDEKKAYDEAINTLRTNTGIIKEVLDPNYNPATANKTQKAVKNAIDTVEKFAVEHTAETEAIRRAELVEYDDPDVSDDLLIKSIDDVISRIFSKIPAKSDSNSTEEVFSFYDTYSLKSLAELKEKATNTVKAQANTAANSAIKALKLNPSKTAEGVVLNELTVEKYNNAMKTLGEDNKNLEVADAKTVVETAKGAVETAEEAVKTAEEQLKNATGEQKKTAEENLVEAKKTLAEKNQALAKANQELAAVNIRDAWTTTPLKDENGNEIKVKDANGMDVTATLETFYQQEYDKVYKVKTPYSDNSTPNDPADDTKEELEDFTINKIQEEMKNLIISENKTKYDAKISEIKNDILICTSDKNSKEYNTYQSFINGTNGTLAVKEKFNTAIKDLSELDKTEEPSNTGLSAIGLSDIVVKTENGEETIGFASQLSDTALINASDAVFVLDGAEMTETSNSFTVNGLTLNLSATTEREDSTENNKKYDTVQITVGKDVDSTYKLVKEAITEYNKLLEEMNTLYNANSSRGYDPLTDEQKESMSETDIENWEKKIKDSLLRRDDTLGSLLTSMRNALSTSYTDDDGKTYSLASYGIVTGHYTEKGKLHIYGDEDDGTYATYTDRLKAALEDDPDKVMETLTHVFGNLYSTMTEKCAKTEISSALTFYNDKQYNNLLKDYEDDLDILEDRIKELEDRYYKQFTAMEKAMSVLQNQSNSLASLLGTGGQ